MQLKPRNDPLKEDAALLDRHADGSGPDGAKLRRRNDYLWKPRSARISVSLLAHKAHRVGNQQSLLVPIVC